MGQYYISIIIDADNNVLAWLLAHDYTNGLKLMEHSYIGNDFLNVVEELFIEGSPYYKSRLVWAGDYADAENGNDDNKNLHSIAYEKEELKINPTSTKNMTEYPYIINHTKKQVVKKGKEDDIHPLSLLTAEGNGRGGGDFRGDDEYVGYWSRDIISIAKCYPENYKLLDITFEE